MHWRRPRVIVLAVAVSQMVIHMPIPSRCDMHRRLDCLCRNGRGRLWGRGCSAFVGCERIREITILCPGLFRAPNYRCWVWRQRGPWWCPRRGIVLMQNLREASQPICWGRIIIERDLIRVVLLVNLWSYLSHRSGGVHDLLCEIYLIPRSWSLAGGIPGWSLVW